MRVLARRVAVTSQKARAPSRADHGQVPLLADVAFSDVILLTQGRLDFLADRVAVRFEGFEDLAEHLLGFSHDVLPSPHARRDPLPVPGSPSWNRASAGRVPSSPGLSHCIAATRRGSE